MQQSTDAQTAEAPSGDQRSMLQLVRDISNDTTTLLRKEIELARQEIVEALVARAKGMAAMAAAGLVSLIALGFLGVAAYRGLALVVAGWLAALIVAGGFLVLAAGAVLVGTRRMKAPPMAPKETQRTVKEDVEWAKQQLKR